MMGDQGASASPSQKSDGASKSGSGERPQEPHHRIPFHDQFSSLSAQQHQQHQQQQPQQQQQPPLPPSHHVNPPFNMSAMAGTLPPISPNTSQRTHFDPTAVYQMQHVAQYTLQRGPSYFDPIAMRAVQQQQHHHQHPQHFYAPSFSQRQHTVPAQALDMYAYGMHHAPYQSLDPRYGLPLGFPMPGTVPGAARGFDQPPQNLAWLDPSKENAQRGSDPAPVPSFPRGPPRKPKQSGHALWVGNLPPAATVVDLKDHFSRDARHDIESLFLISKSNCAFVNYSSEAACVSAMGRFHDSRFHGVRLVCRLRRRSNGANASPSISQTSLVPVTTPSDASAEPAPVPERDGPVIVGHTPVGRSADTTTTSASGSSSPSEGLVKEPAKFFIVKSLTIEDLEASVRNGTWATQSHNEAALSRAFDDAKHVYLIFSANKSGEYFGYARMASQISGKSVNLGAMMAENSGDEAGAPQSIPTPATETAPPGRIIDDSARGTIFWESELCSGDQSQPDVGMPVHKDDREDSIGSGGGGQNWGRQFEIEWLSTTRLPFFRTRGLRNPWNTNREVKIARDGTELEPSVGLRLVQMFHRPTGLALYA